MPVEVTIRMQTVLNRRENGNEGIPVYNLYYIISRLYMIFFFVVVVFFFFF